MRTSEKIYTALVLVATGLFAVLCAVIQIRLLPRMVDQSATGTLQITNVVIGIAALTLCVTAFMNISKAQLRFRPTIIQVVVLTISTHLIALAAWGGWLLYKSRMRMKETSASVSED